MREFDLMIFGATGFTGVQTASYINRLAPEAGLKWAIAGRNKNKLEEMVAEHQLKPAGVVVADALDKSSVDAMIKRTRVLVNLAGPYTIYGPNVVAACAEQGVHYADLSGEVLFTRDMIARHHDTARANGARIIPAAGYEALPFDLGSLLVSERFKEKFGSVPKQVNSVTQFHFKGRFIYPSDTLSGGTWGSAVETFAAEDLDGISDPHLLIDDARSWLPESSQQYNILKNALPKGHGWLAPMVPMPWLNPAVIYRTQELLSEEGGKQGYTYREGMDTSGYVPGDRLLKPVAALSMAMGVEISDRLMHLNNTAPRKALGKILKAIGPKPGDGPKPERLDLWSYTTEFTATGEAGETATATVKGDGQPGYKSTTDIIGQVGLLLAGDEARLPKRTGILTPASALGLDVLDDFAKARLRFE